MNKFEAIDELFKGKIIKREHWQVSYIYARGDKVLYRTPSGVKVAYEFKYWPENGWETYEVHALIEIKGKTYVIAQTEGDKPELLDLSHD